MRQISLILIAGFVFLFSFALPTDGREINHSLIILFAVVATVIPSVLVYLLGTYVTRTLALDSEGSVHRRYRIKQAAIGFEILVLVGYVYNVYILNLPVLIHQTLHFINLPHIRHAFSIFPLLVGLMLIRLALHEIDRNTHRRGAKRREFLSFHLKFLIIPLLPLFAYFVLLDLI